MFKFKFFSFLPFLCLLFSFFIKQVKLVDTCPYSWTILKIIQPLCYHKGKERMWGKERAWMGDQRDGRGFTYWAMTISRPLIHRFLKSWDFHFRMRFGFHFFDWRSPTNCLMISPHFYFLKSPVSPLFLILGNSLVICLLTHSRNSGVIGILLSPSLKRQLLISLLSISPTLIFPPHGYFVFVIFLNGKSDNITPLTTLSCPQVKSLANHLRIFMICASYILCSLLSLALSYPSYILAIMFYRFWNSHQFSCLQALFVCFALLGMFISCVANSFSLSRPNSSFYSSLGFPYPTFKHVEHNLLSTTLCCTQLYSIISTLCCNYLVLYSTKLLDYNLPDFTNFILVAFLVSSSKHVFDYHRNILFPLS